MEVLKYSHQRAKKIFLEYYGWKLVKQEEYKPRWGRLNAPAKYMVVDVQTGKIICTDFTLQGIREFLTVQGFPLKNQQ